MDEQPQQIPPSKPDLNISGNSGSKRSLAIIAGIALVVFILAAGVYYFSFWMGEANQQKISSTEKSVKRNVSSRKLDALDFSKYKSFGAVDFSPNGQHVYYVANEKESPSLFEGKIIIDGKESVCFLGVPLIFSPDGEQILCGVRKGSEMIILANDKQVAVGEGEVIPVFSPDSKRLAFLMRAGKSAFVMIDGVKGKEYDSVFGLVFSPDSKQFAYQAALKRKTLVVLGYQEIGPFDEAGGLVFSEDGKQFAFIAREGAIRFLVLNGKKVDSPYDPGPPVFSSDGKRLAYMAIVEDRTTSPYTFKRFIVLDGVAKETPYTGLYDRLYNPIFSPDGKQLAFRLQKGNREMIVVNNVEGKDYDTVSDPVISPDGKQIAYIAKQGADYFVVLNGQEGKRYAVIEGSVTGKPDISFSPDSTKFAYVARIAYKAHYDGKEYDVHLNTVVLNGKEGQRYYQISNLSFSSDGKSMSYGAVSTAKENGTLGDNDILWVTESFK